MRNRAVLLCVPVLIAGAVVGITGIATAAPPSGADPVTVNQAAVTANINGHVHPASSIQGTIKSTSGTPLQAFVGAYVSGRFVASALSSAGTGHYELDGLFPKPTAVCVSGSSVFTASATGFLGRCYKTASFNGTVPGSATLIHLTSGQHKTGVNIALPKGAAISGRVTAASGGGLSSVSVYAHNRSSGATFFGFTTSTGNYSIKSLTASTQGYTVCFNPFGGNSGTGFLRQCFKNTGWSGSSYPSTATKVSVSLGHTHTGVNQALPRGGAVSGKVTDAGNGNPVKFDSVLVFTSTGKFVGGNQTNAQGQYVVRGLPASTSYRVCAAPDNATPAVTYHGKCWRTAAWNGGRLPSGTNPVSVHLGATHTGINFKLGKTVISLGSIAGTVTENAGGNPLQGATVELFTNSGNFVDSTATDAAGAYTFSQLKASAAGYVVCVSGQFAFSGVVVTPATGWAPRCFDNVGWTGVGVPAAADRVSLSAGQNRSGIDVALLVGGEIDGTVFRFGGSTPATGVQVYLFTAGGRNVTATTSDFTTGTYSFKSLLPGNYLVCFDGTSMFGQAGFLPQCYNNVAWNGTF